MSNVTLTTKSAISNESLNIKAGDTSNVTSVNGAVNISDLVDRYITNGDYYASVIDNLFLGTGETLAIGFTVPIEYEKVSGLGVSFSYEGTGDASIEMYEGVSITGSTPVPAVNLNRISSKTLSFNLEDITSFTGGDVIALDYLFGGTQGKTGFSSAGDIGGPGVILMPGVSYILQGTNIGSGTQKLQLSLRIYDALTALS